MNGGPADDDDDVNRSFISKHSEQVLASRSLLLKQVSPRNNNKLLGRGLPPLKPPPGSDYQFHDDYDDNNNVLISRRRSRDNDIIAPLRRRSLLLTAVSNDANLSDQRKLKLPYCHSDDMKNAPKSNYRIAGPQFPSDGDALGMRWGCADDAAVDDPTATTTKTHRSDGIPQCPELTENLPPQNRLKILLKQLEAPHNKAVMYFRQADLLRLTEAIRQLCLISTWESEQPLALNSLEDIVDKTENLLRGAMSAQLFDGDGPGRSPGTAMLKEVLTLSEDCFIKCASLEVLLQQLESQVSLLFLSKDDEPKVVRLVRATAALLAANDINKRGASSQFKVTAGNAITRRRVVAVWIKAIGRLSSECAMITPEGPLPQLVINQILLHEEIDVIFQTVLQLLQGSISNLSLKQTLELLVSDKKLHKLSAANSEKFIVGAMLPFLNSNVVCNSSPSDLLTLLANLVIDTLGSQEASLTSIIEQLNFKNFGSAAFPHALIVASLTRNQSCEGQDAQDALHRSQHQQYGSFHILLRSLANGRKLGYLFNTLNIAKGCKREVTEAFNSLFCARSESFANEGLLFNQILDRCAAEQSVPHISTGADANLHRAFLSPLVVCHAGIATRSPVQIQYLTMLMLMALASSGEEQDELAVPPGSRDQNRLFDQLHSRLCETSLYFLDSKPAGIRGHDKATYIHTGLQKHSTKLFDVVALRLRQMCSSKQTGWSLKTRVKQILETMHHFINIDKDQLAFLLQYRGKLDKFSTAIDAVTDTFDVFTVRRGPPHKWKTSDIPGMIFYYFCFAKYPLSSFKRWVTDSLDSTTVSGDVQQPSKVDIDAVFSNFESRRDRLHGRKDIAEIGYKCMHHSQAFAVMIALQQVEKGLNPFLRVGTGQGKSLILALLAAHYANQGRKVYIFTCFSHLAQRDHKRFKSFYESIGIESVAVTDVGGHCKCPEAVKVIYSDLHTFLCERQQCAIKRCKQDPGWVFGDYEGLFSSALDVVLLDEFDALVLMHNGVGNTVFRVNEIVPTGHPPPECLTDTSQFKGYMASKNPDLGHQFWERLNYSGIDDGISNWLNQSGGWRTGYSGYDALGKQHNYVGGRLHELSNEGTFHGRILATKCLAVLQSARCVIGLSGSISGSDVGCFSELFARKPSYIAIPPYYGLAETRNLQVAHEVGLSNEAWRAAVVSDASAAVEKGRPVLVFLHPDMRTEWEALQQNLQSVASANDGSFQLIKEEKDVQDSVLDKACTPQAVTLSSHVAGRGADFVVQNHIKRRGGLHVIIAFQPEQDGMLDVRMVDQMKGRTARMGAPGSFSILTTQNLAPHQVETIIGKPAKLDAHQISCAVFSKMAQSTETDDSHWKRYAFLMLFFDDMDKLPRGLEEKLGDTIGGIRTETGQDYLARHIIGFPNFSTLENDFNQQLDPDTFAYSNELHRTRRLPTPPPTPPPPPPRRSGASAEIHRPAYRGSGGDGFLAVVAGAALAATAVCSIQ